MSTSKHVERTALAGLRMSSRAWWIALFEPTSALTPDRQRDLNRARDRGWQREAACAQADPEAWFPTKGSTAPPQVFAICADCPVRRSCLATALLHREHGVWAGTTFWDRQRLYRLFNTGTPTAVVLDAALADRRLFPGSREAA